MTNDDAAVLTLTMIAVGTMVSVTAIGLLSIHRRNRTAGVVDVGRELERLNARFDRLELAVDTIAVEVERIGESERFAVKVLASRPETSPLPALRASAEGRVITPH